MCLLRSRTRARGWIRPSRSESSNHSSRQSRTGLAWDFRSAVQSSKRMAGACGRHRAHPTARPFALLFRSGLTCSAPESSMVLANHGPGLDKSSRFSNAYQTQAWGRWTSSRARRHQSQYIRSRLRAMRMRRAGWNSSAASIGSMSRLRALDVSRFSSAHQKSAKPSAELRGRFD